MVVVETVVGLAALGYLLHKFKGDEECPYCGRLISKHYRYCPKNPKEQRYYIQKIIYEKNGSRLHSKEGYKCKVTKKIFFKLLEYSDPAEQKIEKYKEHIEERNKKLLERKKLKLKQLRNESSSSDESNASSSNASSNASSSIDESNASSSSDESNSRIPKDLDESIEVEKDESNASSSSDSSISEKPNSLEAFGHPRIIKGKLENKEMIDFINNSVETTFSPVNLDEYPYLHPFNFYKNESNDYFVEFKMKNVKNNPIPLSSGCFKLEEDPDNSKIIDFFAKFETLFLEDREKGVIENFKRYIELKDIIGDYYVVLTCNKDNIKLDYCKFDIHLVLKEFSIQLKDVSADFEGGDVIQDDTSSKEATVYFYDKDIKSLVLKGPCYEFPNNKTISSGSKTATVEDGKFKYYKTKPNIFIFLLLEYYFKYSLNIYNCFKTFQFNKKTELFECVFYPIRLDLCLNKLIKESKIQTENELVKNILVNYEIEINGGEITKPNLAKFKTTRIEKKKIFLIPNQDYIKSGDKITKDVIEKKCLYDIQLLEMITEDIKIYLIKNVKNDSGSLKKININEAQLFLNNIDVFNLDIEDDLLYKNLYLVSVIDNKDKTADILCVYYRVDINYIL